MDGGEGFKNKTESARKAGNQHQVKRLGGGI